MLFTSILPWAFLAGAVVAAIPNKHGRKHSGVPMARIKNGTLQGRHVPEYEVDYFLSVPYAQPPVDQLRFRRPQAVNQSWNGVRDATELPLAVCRIRWKQRNRY